MSDRIRNGKGHRAYRRKRAALRNHYQRNSLPCDWCGRPFDWTITDYNHPGSFTADHTEAIAAGGHLVRQQLTGMHRECNARKGAAVAPVIRPAT